MALRRLLVVVFIGAAGMTGVWAQAPKKGCRLTAARKTSEGAATMQIVAVEGQ